VLDQLTADMKTAMKAGEKDRLSVIRMLISELKNARIAAGGDLDESTSCKVLMSYAKKRREAMDTAQSAGLHDRAAREKFEYTVTMSYVPESYLLTGDALRALVRRHVEAVGGGPSAFGRVMKAVLAEADGRADGKAISAMVRELLAT